MDQPSVISLGLILALAFWIIPARIARYWTLSRYPIIHGPEHRFHFQREKDYLSNSKAIYKKSYTEFRNIIHRIITEDGEKIVLPLKHLEELRALPEDTIDSHTPIRRALESDNTGLNSLRHADFLPHIIKSDLTRNLARINTMLSDEVNAKIKEQIPPAEDGSWTVCAIEVTLLQVIAAVSGRAFVGPDLCRAPEYVDACTNFTLHLFKAIRALKRWPRVVRPLGRYFTPELSRVREYTRDANRVLMPVIKARRQQMRLGEEAMPDDVLQWMLEKAEKDGVSDEDLCGLQLTLIMASINTTAKATTQVLFDLAAYPQVIPDLRKEIETVKAKHGGITTHALFEMKLLDSVMKESNRRNPSGLSRFLRYVRKPITLSDGSRLPRDTMIEVPWYPVAHDDEIYPDAAVFNPYRFYNIRTGVEQQQFADDDRPPASTAAAAVRSRSSSSRRRPGNHRPEQYQFASVTDADMLWGYGRHACPGRFFAANEIKLILARILLDYDIALPEGVEQRYESVTIGSILVPFPGGKIRLRTRQRC